MSSLKFTYFLVLLLIVSILNLDNLVTSVSIEKSNGTLAEVKRATCNPDDQNSCKNWGECTRQGEDAFCICQEGTSGDDCSVVEKCKEDNFCKEGSGGICRYVGGVYKAYCDCTDPEKEYDIVDNKCRATCIPEDKNSCKNGGECTKLGEDAFCVCMEGTSGDDCSVVEKCLEENFCKEGSGGICRYMVGENKAVCHCMDSKSEYDIIDNKCRGQCNSHSDCMNGGHCTQAADNDSAYFCKCPTGTDGEYCQRVPECDAVDCGSDAVCKMDANQRNAVCICKDETLVFDKIDKRCKDITEACATDIPECEISGGSCTLTDGNFLCLCPSGYVFHAHVGCTDARKRCELAFPNCTETGGLCFVQQIDQTSGYGYKCVCPRNSGWEEDRGCTVNSYLCDREIPSCRSGGGFCRYHNISDHTTTTQTIACFCPDNKVFQEREGCIDGNGICNYRMPECNATGGVCSFKDGNFECQCRRNTTFVRHEGCLDKSQLCNYKLPECTLTGGRCIYMQNNDPYCFCPDSTVLMDDTRCVDPDTLELCRSMLPGCTSTGGSCRLVDMHPYCDCPYRTKYEKYFGCIENRQKCDYLIPECERTGGICFEKNNFTDVECICGNGTIYERYVGCEDERISKVIVVQSMLGWLLVGVIAILIITNIITLIFCCRKK